jgi:dUTP pyrophosphatase
MSKEIKVKKLSDKATVPVRNNNDDAGLDLYSTEDVVIPPGEGRLIPSNIAIELPPATVGLICDRSSVGSKGIKVHGGVVDVPYRGDIKVCLWNNSKTPYEIKQGHKIAQILVIPILIMKPVEVTELSDTTRGDKGFGSSGK